MKKQKVSLTLDEDLLDVVDSRRGNVKRSTFLNDVIAQGLKGYKEEKKKELVEKVE